MPHDEPGPAEPHPWAPDEDPSELVQRLRRLEWPQVSERTRQRCWEQLRREVAGLAQVVPPPAQRQ